MIYFIFSKNGNDPRTVGLEKVKSYHHTESGQAQCLAYTPECGVCLGTVIDKECYVDKSKLTPDERKLMGF